MPARFPRPYKCAGQETPLPPPPASAAHLLPAQVAHALLEDDVLQRADCLDELLDTLQVQRRAVSHVAAQLRQHVLRARVWRCERMDATRIEHMCGYLVKGGKGGNRKRRDGEEGRGCT
eukprot:224935-Chlamydomonas_euryale.AAC.2